MPEFGVCVSCGNQFGDRDGVYFSPSRGGVLCLNCHPAFADRLSLDVRLLRLLRLIQSPTANGPGRRLPRLTRHQTDPVNHLLAQHIEHAVGRPPRTSAYVLPRRGGPAGQPHSPHSPLPPANLMRGARLRWSGLTARSWGTAWIARKWLTSAKFRLETVSSPSI